MPRAKNDNSAAPATEAENGFAALEAKVEEMQVEAAIEAELMIEDRAAAAIPASVASIAPELTPAPASLDGTGRSAYAPPMAGRIGALATPFEGFADIATAAVKIQADALTSLAGVRSPFDLLKAQLAYSQRAAALYFDACAHAGAQMARAAQYLPMPR